MKKLFLISLTICLLTLSLFASDWDVVKYGGPTAYIDQVDFVSADVGFMAVDDDIQKTTDGGLTWTSLATIDNCIDMDFCDANTGYIACKAGFIYKTTDGGVNWTMVADTANIADDYKSVYVLDANTAFFGGKGGFFVKTTDGGSTFYQDDFTFDGSDLNDIAFTDANIGVAVNLGSGGNTWYTEDGGVNWTYVSVAALWPSTLQYQKIYCVDAVGTNTFVIGGYNYVKFKSTDGGKTYTQTGGIQYGYPIVDEIFCIDENTYFVTGRDGWVEKTTDGGTTWTNIDLPAAHTIYNSSFVDANTGYVMGYYGQWFKTTDGGTSWTPLRDWPSIPFWGIDMPTDDKIVVGGVYGGELIVSEDGGVTWPYPTNELTGSLDSYYDVNFIDESTGFVGTSSGEIFKTTDGAATWSLVENTFWLYGTTMNALSTPCEDTLFIAGKSAGFSYSYDAGENWTDHDFGSKTIYSICPISNEVVLLGAASGYLWKYDITNDDTTELVIGSGSMRDIEIRNDVCIVASKPNIYRTTVNDLDTLYTVYESDNTDADEFYDVEFVTDDLVYVVGEGGIVMVSEDAGLTWSIDCIFPEDANLQGAKYRNGALWVVGQDGFIAKRNRMPGDPYSLPIVETGDNGSLDLEWTMNTAVADASTELTVVDSTASDWGSYVMKFTDGDNTGIAHVDNAVLEDYTVSSDIYIVGPADADAPLYQGLAVKSAHDAVGFYRFVYRNSTSSSHGQLRLQGFDGAAWHISKYWDSGVDFDSLETGWHNLKVTVKGNQFCAYLNGQMLPGCPVEDDDPFLSEGYPGIYKYNAADGTVLFDNFMVNEAEATPIVITMEVDMSVWAQAGNFAVGTDSVDVAGTFNDWGGNAIWLDDADGDTVYTASVYGVFPGDAIEYKFRINGSWDDNTAEFPYGGPARTYSATEADTTLFHYYNDEEPPNAISDIDDLLPKKYALHQNYPNPFNPTTTIAFDLPKSSKVNLTVYNLIGQEVMTLKNEMMNAGFYKVTVDASRLSSGVYFYRIQADNYTSLKKMTLLK